uniref:chitinase n=1 Tax=Medicago truncatula TaxID=3880 RepID=I3S2P7_MEDTR|nr:unknown [Medicago truncatula]
MGYVVANLVGVAPLINIVELVVRASVDLLQHRHHRHQHLVPVVVEMLEGLCLLFCLIKCLNIEMMHDALGMDFIPTMVSLPRLDLLMDLVLLVMIPPVRGSSLLSWLKLLMKPPEGGQVHQTVHMRGDIALSMNVMPRKKRYYGRGPIQLTHDYNYGQAGKAINQDLINNPDLVSTNPTVSFKTAIWFWMTPQGNKPSSHDVIIGRWTPSGADRSAGRVPGYGVITNIINGGLECGHGQDARVNDRIGFYRRYCQILGVSPGDNLDCNNQRSFA